MAVKGVFASDNNIPGSRKGDFASGLLETEQTGDSPLFALTAGMNSADATDIIVTWFEENPLTGRITITNNAGVGQTFTLSDISQIVAGCVCLVESTGEYVFVESVAGSNATVTRGFGNTAITSIDGSVTPVGLQRIGTAHEEGSAKPTSIANVGYPRFNYMQTFRNAWDVTGTAKAVEYMTGDLVAKNKRDAAMLHAADIERSIIFGRSAIGVIGGKPFRTMNGIVPQLQTNVTAQVTNTKRSDLNAFVQAIFSRNVKGMPNERIAFCGDTVIAIIDELARINSQYNLSVGETSYGMEIKEWRTPHGKINLITDPLFSQSPLWTQSLLIVHPGVMRTRYLRRTTEDTYDQNGQRAGADADFGVFTTEMSMEYRAEATGGYYSGISVAAAEA